jgi:hypothetical protein
MIQKFDFTFHKVPKLLFKFHHFCGDGRLYLLEIWLHKINGAAIIRCYPPWTKPIPNYSALEKKAMKLALELKLIFLKLLPSFNHQATMKRYKTELKWAFIFTFASMAWVAIEKVSGLHSEHIEQHMVLTNLFAVPAILIYVLALLDKRRKDYHGAMTYVEGFKAGLWITLFVTILAPINQYLVSTFITPEFFPNAIRFAVESGKMSQEEAQSYFSMKNYLLQSVIGAPIMGTITSAVVAVFTKSKVN